MTDDGPTVIRLFGGPGSGKTTALLDRVDELLDEGVEVEDLLLVSYTRAAAAEIGRLNAELAREGRSYLLIGPGRWGSGDRWLGIPVGWTDISSVGAMVEASYEKLRADPSLGSHFFHNIIGMGISFFTVTGEGRSFLDWEQLLDLSLYRETSQVARVRLDEPLRVKVDGRSSQGVILMGRAPSTGE